jgi:hypothetical protein
MQKSKIIPRIFEERESVETERLFVHFDGGEGPIVLAGTVNLL